MQPEVKLWNVQISLHYVQVLEIENTHSRVKPESHNTADEVLRHKTANERFACFLMKVVP